MNAKQIFRSSNHRLALLVIVLLLTLALLVGSAWARYQQRMVERVYYSAADNAEVYLWSAMDGETLYEGDGVWMVSGSQRIMSFYISNGVDAETAAQTGLDTAEYPEQSVAIRLIASLGVSNGETMKVVLHISDGTTTLSYPAAVQKIEDNSPMAATFGSGWVYTFCDSAGNELLWNLEGGQLSVLQAQLVLEQIDLVDTSLLQLQVSAR